MENNELYGKRHKSLAKAIFKEDLENVLSNPKWILVDIRYPEDFDSGHLQNAINVLDGNTLEELITKNENKNILLNCYSGHTVSILSSDLVKKGFKNIYFLDEEISDCL